MRKSRIWNLNFDLNYIEKDDNQIFKQLLYTSLIYSYIACIISEGNQVWNVLVV